MTITGSSSRVLLVTGEPISENLAGPAIRSWQMATALAAAGHSVTIASTGGVAKHSAAFSTAVFSGRTAVELVDGCDVVIFQGSFYATMPWLADKPQVQIMDLYDPFQLEFLYTNHGLDEMAAQRRLDELTVELNAQLGRADLVLCASTRQRDLWLGYLGALGRLGSNALGAGDRLVRIVPFGAPDEPFAIVPVDATTPVLRTRARGIGRDDVVLLWAGGLYDWFDPQTLIRAVELACRKAPELKLFFLASAHPNPGVEAHGQAAAARSLAAQLDVLGTHVFFNDGWVPYADRVAYLAESDIGVTTHPDSAETHFSFRTRNLDYLWAGLPLITTDGDVFAELVASSGAGAVVPAGDVNALAEVLVGAARDADRRRRWSMASAELGEQWRWNRVLRPLLDYMDAPQRSTMPVRLAAGTSAAGLGAGGLGAAGFDLAGPPGAHLPGAHLPGAHPLGGAARGVGTVGVWSDVRTAVRHLRAGGWALLWRRLKDRRRRSALRQPRR